MHPSLFFPYAARQSQFQFSSITPGEEDREILVYDQPILTVADFLVTKTDTSWDSLPCQLSPICSHFKSVTEFLCLIVIPHETQEGHVHWCHSEAESLKVQTELFAKTVEHLHRFQEMVSRQCLWELESTNNNN